ncbi:MAG: hypothetical protein WBN03_10190 [Desulfobacterales bacterium]
MFVCNSEALELVRQEKPDLITLDLQPPDEWTRRFTAGAALLC